MQLDLRRAASEQAVCAMATEQSSEPVEFTQCATRLAAHALPEPPCRNPETATLEDLENPTAELDAYAHTVAQNEVEIATARANRVSRHQPQLLWQCWAPATVAHHRHDRVLP